MRKAAQGMFDPVVQTGFGASNAAQGNWTGAARNMSNAARSSRNFGRNARTVAEGYGTDIKSAFNKARNAVFKWQHHRAAKRDSIWAEGFYS